MEIIRNGKRYELTKQELFKAYIEYQEDEYREIIYNCMDDFLKKEDYEIMKSSKEFINCAIDILRGLISDGGLEVTLLECLEEAIIEANKEVLNEIRNKQNQDETTIAFYSKQENCDCLFNDNRFKWKKTINRDGSYSKKAEITYRQFKFACEYNSKFDYVDIYCRMVIKPIYNSTKKCTVVPLAHLREHNINNNSVIETISKWKDSFAFELENLAV